MTTSESFEALRRANPRAKAGFVPAVDAVRTQIVTAAANGDLNVDASGAGHSRRRFALISAIGASLAAAAAVVALLSVGSPRGGPGVEDAIAAVRNAATVTAASAERSGTAVVRLTHNGKVWASTTVRWHGRDVAVSHGAPRRLGRAGSALLVVDGTLYGVEDGRWVVLGTPESIDPDSGTTPDEYLAAAREDVGGVTLRRISDGMTELTTRRLDDGSTVYSGIVAAGLIAREEGFKEGGPIRVLPFGYVAHGDAADPAAPLVAALNVGVDGIVREITVTWGAGASAWTYTVTYSNLGATPPPAAPANARPFARRVDEG
jgi:hypothetical protein